MIILATRQSMAKPCLNRESDLLSEIVLNLLKKVDNNVVLCSLPPVNPSGGEVYLFLPSSKKNNKGILTLFTVWFQCIYQ